MSQCFCIWQNDLWPCWSTHLLIFDVWSPIYLQSILKYVQIFPGCLPGPARRRWARAALGSGRPCASGPGRAGGLAMFGYHISIWTGDEVALGLAGNDLDWDSEKCESSMVWMLQHARHEFCARFKCVKYFSYVGETWMTTKTQPVWLGICSSCCLVAFFLSL